jgi:hypothetical protein
MGDMCTQVSVPATGMNSGNMDDTCFTSPECAVLANIDANNRRARKHYIMLSGCYAGAHPQGVAASRA